MGYAEEAKINLGKVKSGKGDESTLQVAQVQATLAVLDALGDLSSQVAYLSDTIERQNEAKEPGAGKVW